MIIRFIIKALKYYLLMSLIPAFALYFTQAMSIKKLLTTYGIIVLGLVITSVLVQLLFLLAKHFQSGRSE